MSVPAVRDEQPPLEPLGGGEVWERLKGESSKVFGYFAEYRNMGRARSMRKLAAQLKLSRDVLSSHSVRWHWLDRVDAYDDYTDRLQREALESERMRVNREGASVFRIGLARAGTTIRGIDTNELSAGDAIRLAEVSFRGLRLATGQATDNFRQLGGMTQEEVERVVRGMYEIGLRLLPEERHARYAAEMQAFFETGKLPT